MGFLIAQDEIWFAVVGFLCALAAGALLGAPLAELEIADFVDLGFDLSSTYTLWAGLIGGAIVAGIFHTGKAAARPVANVGTGGFAAPVLSTAEDATSILLSLAAVFAPILALVLLAVVAWVMWRLWRRVVAMRERRAARAAV